MDTASLIAQSSASQAQASYAAGMQARVLAAQNAAAGTAPQDPRNAQKAKQAGQQFEAFFVGQMMEYMMSGIKSDPTFGGGQAEETWRSMLNQEYGKEISKSGQLGIGSMITKTILQAQEHGSAAAAANATPATPDAADEIALAAEPQAAAAAGSLAVPRQGRIQ
jgi:Rod binding domain-containing protein